MRLQTAAYPNNARTAHAVYAFLEEGNLPEKTLTLRPFNRFDPAYTEWWMIPSSGWPAYRYGKLCFWRYPNDSDGLMYVGYYVEKGLDSSMSGMPELNKAWIMSKDWYWHSFVDELASGRFEAIAKTVAKSCKQPVRLLFQVNEFNKVPKEDEPRSKPSDALIFDLGEGENTLSVVEPAVSVLSKLNEEMSPADLAANLSALDLRFHWLDLVIGVRFRYGNKSESTSAARDLWSLAMAPWMPLVK